MQLPCLVGFLLFDAIFEDNTGNHLGQVFKTANSQPVFLCALAKLKHHRQHRLAGHTALGLIGTMADGGKGGLNRISGAQMYPVLGWKVIKAQ